jgi:hypothetical protein
VRYATFLHVRCVSYGPYRESQETLATSPQGGAALVVEEEDLSTQQFQ